MLTLLAIDPGLAALGWVALHGCRVARDGDDCVQAGSLHTSPKFGTERDRISFLRRGLGQLFERFQPDLVAVEDFVFMASKVGQGGYAVACIGGIVQGLAEGARAQLQVLDKNTVNRSLGLTGQCPKSRVRLMVEAALKLKPNELRNEHIISAGAVGFVAHQRFLREAT